MPDLKSELKKLEALRFDDEGTTQQEITMHKPNPIGVSATMFNVIRDNPASNRQKLIKLAEEAGVVRASSTSLITQFVHRGLVRKSDEDGVPVFFAERNTYKPGYAKRPAKPAKQTVVETNGGSIAEASSNQSVQDLLNNMSIVKARALYDELKKIFGG